MKTFQELIATLQNFWAAQGCVVHQGHDVETGAGTFNPATFFRCLGPEPYRAAYVELSRRPKDGRYAQNPNRMQLFHQYQVVIKPSPPDIQQQYIRSLEAIGFQLEKHDIRFVHDDWEQPTLGASGLGWEVWRDGMEVTQFTYFQNVAGQELSPITVELTYGLERLAMVVQGVDSVWDLQWNDALTYRDVYEQNEVEWCTYNFEEADTEMWLRHFRGYEAEALRLVEKGLPYPSYDFVMKASHAFNLLDSRGIISVTERTGYIQRIREMSRRAAECYLEQRERHGFPLMERFPETRIELEQPLPPMPAADPSRSDDFLLEIGSEELPATFVPIGMRNLYTGLLRLLEELGLPHGGIDIYGTPRRLAARIKGLPFATAPQTIEKRGPALEAAYDAAGNPTPAARGFFSSLGLEPPKRDEATVREQKGRSYLFATAEVPAKSTAELLAQALPSLILGIDFPKKMRWGSGEIRYARPLRWLLALHGDAVIPFTLDGLTSDRTSSGHAQRDPVTFELNHADDYLRLCREHKVLADVDERKEAILLQLAEIEAAGNTQVLELEAVLAEVLHLTEWPELATIDFDHDFLQIPAEVLASEMVQHQRYFPLVDAEGRMVNQCVITADNTPSDEIRHGNGKVLSARLADGKFLYAQDLQTPLINFEEKLAHITFREGLGTLRDKCKRLSQMAVILHGHLQLGAIESATRAALLCKADLATELVGEFPDLQGTIGKHYALAHGENLAVAQAIDEHYMPRGDQAHLPSSPAGILLSIADRIDNILSCFALGLIPSSSSDPYGLRRQALGIIRILIHHKLHLPLVETLRQCFATFGRPDDVVDQVADFFSNRIKTVFQDYGLTKDETEAALTHPFSDIYDTYLRAQALQTFRQENAAYPHLAEVFKRAKGQLQTAGLSDLSFDPALLAEPAEQKLHAALEKIEAPMATALESRDYAGAYALLSELQMPLGELFDNVRILVEETKLQRNRLALLEKVLSLFSKLLDFSKLKLKG
jgi:glycyl-tRNA synthetase